MSARDMLNDAMYASPTVSYLRGVGEAGGEGSGAQGAVLVGLLRAPSQAMRQRAATHLYPLRWLTTLSSTLKMLWSARRAVLGGTRCANVVNVTRSLNIMVMSG